MQAARRRHPSLIESEAVVRHRQVDSEDALQALKEHIESLPLDFIE